MTFDLILITLTAATLTLILYKFLFWCWSSWWNNRAYQEGYGLAREARRNGCFEGPSFYWRPVWEGFREDNPYPEGSSRHKAWDEGFRAG